jgi:hypothetical protein
VHAIIGKRKTWHWLDGFWFELDEKSWFVRKFYQGWGGTTLGHGGWYREGKIGDEKTSVERRGGRNFIVTEQVIDTEIEFHEHVHVEQYEAAMLNAFLVGAAVFLGFLIFTHIYAGIILGGGLWFTGYFRMAVSRWLTAWMRGEEVYRGSAHEEAAYALAEEYERKKRGIK